MHDGFSRRWFFTGVAVLVAAGLQAPCVAADAVVRIQLDSLNGSGESGVAILTPRGAKTVVELKMTGGPGDPQPTHFHTGTCAQYAPRPLYMLQSIVKGSSVTTLDIPIEKLTSGDLVINVHKSFTDIATIAICAVAKPS